MTLSTATSAILKYLRLILVVLVLLVIGQLASGQGAPINDSLLQISKDDLLPDSIRFRAINQCYREYSYAVPDSMLPLIEYHRTYAKSKDNKKEEVLSLNEKGYVYFLKGESGRAMTILKDATKLLEILKDSVNLAKQYNNIAGVYNQQGSYLEALQYYHSSLEVFTQSDDEASLATIYSNIGLIYHNVGAYDLALSSLEQSIDLYSDVNQTAEHGDTWTLIGATHLQLKNYEKALTSCRKALGLIKGDEDMTFLGDTYSIMYDIHYQLGNLDSARVYAELKFDIFDRMGQRSQVLNSQVQLLRILGDTDIDRAISEGRALLPAVDKLGAATAKMEMCELLYTWYKKKGMIEESLSMYEKYVAHKNEIDIQQNKLKVIKEAISRESILALAKAEAVDKEKQSALKSRFRSRMLSAFGLGLLLLGLGYFVFQRKVVASDAERAQLIGEISELKKSASRDEIPAMTGVFELKREKIESAINRVLNETDWNVLTILVDDPVISNKDIAARAFMSVDGIGSSLRRMYTFFDIKESKYKKISLLMEAIKISNS